MAGLALVFRPPSTDAVLAPGLGTAPDPKVSRLSDGCPPEKKNTYVHVRITVRSSRLPFCPISDCGTICHDTKSLALPAPGFAGQTPTDDSGARLRIRRWGLPAPYGIPSSPQLVCCCAMGISPEIIVDYCA